MVNIETSAKKNEIQIPEELLEGKRHLNKKEIEILEKNQNVNTDGNWNNIYVCDEDGAFNPELIHLSFFSGFVILGKITDVELSYHDLHLECGVRRSRLNNVVIGDYCVVNNVSYLITTVLETE